METCAEAGPALLADSDSPHTALVRWIDLFVDFLVAKHGLAEALQSDDATFVSPHAYFLDRLVPVCAELLDAAASTDSSSLCSDDSIDVLAQSTICLIPDEYFVSRTPE